MFINEKERKINVFGSYDVVVAGGGISGIAAALASARTGAKTLLLEKMYLLGGLATNGLVTIYLPICDGKGHQVSFGIAEELLRLSVKFGYETTRSKKNAAYPIAWMENGSLQEKKEERFRVDFNASAYAILCEQLLRENGVEILYGTAVCGCDVKNGKIKNLFIENKSGRQAVFAKSFVDASGDADLCFFSGEETEEFKQGNTLASWYYKSTSNGYELKMLGYADIPDKYKAPEERNIVQTRYKGLDGKEISDMVIESHKNILDDFLIDGKITAGHALGSIASVPQLRMTRRLKGIYELDDTESFKEFDDSVGMISDWRKAGPIYELPFSTLYGKQIRNLTVCGRCISVTDSMWDITRVIPCCAVSGQAAGTAAALTDDFAMLSISELQKELGSVGVKLHLNEITE